MSLKWFPLLALLLFFEISNAQKIKGSWYVGVSPTLGNSFNTYKNNSATNLRDSLKREDRWRSAVGASILYSLELENKNQLMFGLQFQNFGFTRRREDFKFLDTLHPEIGIMTDLSQTGSNYINFNYRYQYITIPVIYSAKISNKSMKSSTIHYMIGGSISTLINHDIRAVLHGFTTKGKDVFILKDQLDDPARFNINFQTGFRLENPLFGKNTFIYIQPTFTIPLLTANYGPERHHLYSLACDIGIIFKPKSENN